jgi:hypothetical protein
MKGDNGKPILAQEIFGEDFLRMDQATSQAQDDNWVYGRNDVEPLTLRASTFQKPHILVTTSM